MPKLKNAPLAIGTRLTNKDGLAARIESWDASDYVTIRFNGDGWGGVFGIAAANFWHQVDQGIWAVEARDA